jgi:hypothetical protein
MPLDDEDPSARPGQICATHKAADAGTDDNRIVL